MGPINRHPALVPLSMNHHRALVVVRRIRIVLSSDIETERIRKFILFSYENELVPHFDEEERLLFIHMQ